MKNRKFYRKTILALALCAAASGCSPYAGKHGAAAPEDQGSAESGVSAGDRTGNVPEGEAETADEDKRGAEKTKEDTESLDAAKDPKSPGNAEAADGAGSGDFRAPESLRELTAQLAAEKQQKLSLDFHFTADALRSRTSRRRAMRQAMESFGPSGTGTDARELLLFRLAQDRLDTGLLSSGLELYAQPLTPENGLQIQIPRMLSSMPVRNTGEADQYLTLFGKVPGLYKELLAFEQEKAGAGLLTGGDALEAIIRSFSRSMVRPDNHFLTKSFEEKLNAIPGLSDAAKKDYLKRHRIILSEQFIPACRALTDGLTALQATASKTGGLGEMPEGRRYYAFLIASGSGNSAPLEQLTANIEARVADRLDEMAALTEAFPQLAAEADSRAFAFSDAGSALAWLKASTADIFPPAEDFSCELRPLEHTNSPAGIAARWAGESAASAEDGAGMPDILYVDESAQNMPLGIAMEGWPGLMYRAAYERSASAGRDLLSLADESSAAAWRLYAGQYAWADGNGLSPELNQFKAAYEDAMAGLYALMDIHANYDGWSREQFASFCASYGFADPDVVDQLLCSALANPGADAAPYIGFISLDSLREDAKKRLGEKFSLMEFHRFVLDMGPVPYRLLEPYYRAWMLTQLPERGAGNR